MSFSAIEEELRPRVVERCYWPLLRLIERTPLRAGIEAPAFTLEVIQALEPAWIAALRALMQARKVELIGSGYAQLIGPLVPAEVNAANLRIGNTRYEQLLGQRPRIALVNEQAYSSGLVAHYLNAGFAALIMEWNNAARAHRDWSRAMRLAPAIAADQHGRTIPMLWNDSVAFQKFQRYAHAEMELEAYLRYLRTELSGGDAFCLYGNDVEIFDFRPGRFATEAAMAETSEWTRIEQLMTALEREPGVTFALPSEVLESVPPQPQPRQLESAEAPVLVKKQPKYNITRWAVTGRDDLGINSACWRIYETLCHDAAAGDDRWRELCYLWSSDFRTHITASRWQAFRERLARVDPGPATRPPAATGLPVDGSDPRVVREHRRLRVTAPGVTAIVNLRRGLALDELTFPDADDVALAGTIEHGTFDDIALSADWYTGNLVLEAPGAHKVTDLELAQDVDVRAREDGAIVVTGTIPTRLGAVHKTLTLGAPSGCVEIRFHLDWPSLPDGSLRLGFLTLMPSVFDERSVFYRTHNGGFEAETFPLANATVEHGAPVSFLVSASHAVGLTQGVLEIGDARRVLRVEVDKTTAALIGMVMHRRVGDSFFCQVQLSALELDDTSAAGMGRATAPREIVLRYSARRTQ